MRVTGSLALALAWISAAWGQSAPSVGPARGSLVVVGGGQIGADISSKFLSLAGGPESLIVVIPTADDRDTLPADYLEKMFLSTAGAKNLVLRHTRSREEASTEAFVEPIRRARGVWFPGGRHWRLVDSYLGTPVQTELEKLLERGGVIGGTSAGATIQGSFLVRGARSGNTIMIDDTYRTGFGYLRNTAIDQHLLARKREKDMLQVVEKFPNLLGIGIDESTAIVVSGDQAEVIGASKVAIYEHGKPFYFLSPGDWFDLKQRRKR